jgi:hypothetical protein
MAPAAHSARLTKLSAIIVFIPWIQASVVAARKSCFDGIRQFAENKNDLYTLGMFRFRSRIQALSVDNAISLPARQTNRQLAVIFYSFYIQRLVATATIDRKKPPCVAKCNG